MTRGEGEVLMRVFPELGRMSHPQFGLERALLRARVAILLESSSRFEDGSLAEWTLAVEVMELAKIGNILGALLPLSSWPTFYSEFSSFRTFALVDALQSRSQVPWDLAFDRSPGPSSVLVSGLTRNMDNILKLTWDVANREVGRLVGWREVLFLLEAHDVAEVGPSLARLVSLRYLVLRRPPGGGQ